MRSDRTKRLLRAVTTMGRVWQHAFLNAFVSPGRFRQVMPELRRVCDAVYHPGIGELKIFDLPGEGPIQILGLDGGGGGMNSQDLYALLRVVRWLKPRKIFEIGTFNGFTTAHLVMNSQAEVYTLDLPLELATDLVDYNSNDMKLLHQRDQIGMFYQNMDVKGRIHQLFGDSRKFDFAPYRESADVVLIDACHHYDCVISDSRHALEILGERGAILWHDFANLIDVTRACKHLAKVMPIMHIEGTWLALHLRGLSISGLRRDFTGSVAASQGTLHG